MNLPLMVRDYMSTRLLTVTPETDVMQAVQTMVDHDVSGLLVVDAEGRLTGILTERDCIAVASSAGYYDELGGPVSCFMTAPVDTAAPGDSLADVAERMAGSEHRRFPVLQGDRLVGLISRRDVLRALAQGSWFARARNIPPAG